jgi:hypothetical protein
MNEKPGLEPGFFCSTGCRRLDGLRVAPGAADMLGRCDAVWKSNYAKRLPLLAARYRPGRVCGRVPMDGVLVYGNGAGPPHLAGPGPELLASPVVPNPKGWPLAHSARSLRAPPLAPARELAFWEPRVRRTTGPDSRPGGPLARRWGHPAGVPPPRLLRLRGRRVAAGHAGPGRVSTSCRIVPKRPPTLGCIGEPGVVDADGLVHAGPSKGLWTIEARRFRNRARQGRRKYTVSDDGRRAHGLQSTDRAEGSRCDRRLSHQHQRRELVRRSSGCSRREAPADVAPSAASIN